MISFITGIKRVAELEPVVRKDKTDGKEDWTEIPQSFFQYKIARMSKGIIHELPRVNTGIIWSKRELDRSLLRSKNILVSKSTKRSRSLEILFIVVNHLRILIDQISDAESPF